jgi:LAS superfamily LD-carboxypeptidase LdcB
MKAAARTAGIDLQLEDGYRNYAEQQRLYDLYQSGRGNLAARPGESDHGWGLSVDINTADQGTYQWLVKHAGEYGFVNDVPSERWHWTYKPSQAAG